ncbi:MAG: SAM-dependent methyltransferase [Burkholderiaceae bacterium]
MPDHSFAPSTDDGDSVDAIAVSARLTALIHDAIDHAGGWIPFSRFMDLALYAPGLGYYSAGALKIGSRPGDGSDFVTAPELTPLFGRTLARPVADILAAGGDTVIELGGGSGKLAATVLAELESLDVLPAHYLLLEVSGDFRQRQAATLQRLVPHLAKRVRWVDALPDRLHGAIIGNEVLDALPVDLMLWDGHAWLDRGVTVSGTALRFADRPAAPGARQATEGLPVPYLTESHAAMRGLVSTLVSRMTSASTMLMIDYGFPASEYYHPQRAGGTLMGHRRHRASIDVLALPGLQDITAHVDFSAVAVSAAESGGVTIGYTSQARFLIDCGIADLMRGDAADVRGWAPQAAALQTLLSEAEMGELFKVIAIARSDRDVIGFGAGDRRESL